MYKPKSLPYNMRINDAITWYSNEIYYINQSLKDKSSTKEQHHRLMEYKARCMQMKETLEWKKQNGVKVVNKLASRAKVTYGRW